MQAAFNAAVAANLDAVRYITRDWLMAELDIAAPEFTAPSESTESTTRASAADRHAMAADWVEALWESHVEEPRRQGWEKIDDLIRGPLGLGWPTADAINWTPNRAYDKNGIFAWCGTPPARGLGEYGLKASIRFSHVASCSRLREFCRDTPREVPLDQLQRGDILVVSAGIKAAGEHITMVRHVEGGLVHTIEGNARGRLPNGRDGEGVIYRTRPLPTVYGGMTPADRARFRCPVSGRKHRGVATWGYRFLDEDFADAA